MSDETEQNGNPVPPESAVKGDGVHDPVTGHFLKGHPGGPGRRAGVDFKALIRRECGDTVEARVVAVYNKLMEKAEAGDTRAAKLLFDHLLDKEALQVEVGGYTDMSETERAARVVQLLEVADARRKAAEGGSQPQANVVP